MHRLRKLLSHSSTAASMALVVSDDTSSSCRARPHPTNPVSPSATTPDGDGGNTGAIDAKGSARQPRRQPTTDTRRQPRRRRPIQRAKAGSPAAVTSRRSLKARLPTG